MLEFRLLGPVELRVGGEPVALGPAKRRAVLAALAVDAGRPVPVETMIDRVWGDQPPPEARNTLYSHVARLRRLLADLGANGADATLVRRPGAYVLKVAEDRVDLLRARRLISQGRAATEPSERVTLLAAALGLWRGDALTDIAGAWAEQTRDTVEEQRLAALVLCSSLELEFGDSQAVIDKTVAAVARHPLAEPLVAVHLRALFQAGRTAEALRQYATTRRVLAEELGTEPGRELQELHAALLRGDLSTLRRPHGPAPPTVIIPRQLPADVPAFVGRKEALRRLDRMLDTGAGPGNVAVVAAVSGTAGVGKTALALRWAHRVRDRFPDGQLYVNLRGFAPSDAMDPAGVVRGFLDALRIPPGGIPAGTDAQIALYRSLLADRRILVVLDNARDADQVRPLLPGAPGCRVLVTSRNKLTGLVATDGADLLLLDLLSSAEARDLLAARLGPDRVSAEPDALRRIVARCAGLPLALAVVAGQAAANPGFSLTELADQVDQAGVGLDAFEGDDPVTNLRAVFSWSYRAASPAAARLFRLLGLHPGPDAAISAAASLAGTSPNQVRPALTELTRSYLVEHHGTGRYGFHDLLRAYAVELGGRLDAADDRRAARRRLLDHYLHTSYAASVRLVPHRDAIPLAPPESGVTIEHVTDDSALGWFAAEQAVLLGATEMALREGFDRHALQLGWCLVIPLVRWGRWHDMATAARIGLQAAERMADVGGQAFAHRVLARACHRLGLLGEAEDHVERAIGGYAQGGNLSGQATAISILGEVMEAQGRYREALAHARRSLELYARIGYLAGQGAATNTVGWYHALLGEYHDALTWCQRALALQIDAGDRAGQANTWHSLGYVHNHLGRPKEAVDCHRRAVDLHRELDSRYARVVPLIDLGDVHLAAGQVDAARTAWREALDILEDLQDPDAEKVRARLRSTGPRTP